MLLRVREALRTAALGGYGCAISGVVGGVGGPVTDDVEDKEVASSVAS